MNAVTHLEELRRRHQELSEKVEVAQRNPGTDDLKIVEMKKLKLRLKEEIGRLEEGEAV